MKILVSVPNEGWIHKRVVFALLRLQTDQRHALRIIMPTHRPYENNLHRIVRDLLRGNEDFWLNIDSDNPPRNNPLDLVALDKDIIGLPAPIWHYLGKRGERPMYWSAYKIAAKAELGYNEWPVRSGLQKVDAVGTGCILIARRVFEDPRMQQGAFSRKLNRDGTVERGNDISFCERARECGYEIWAHFGYPCDHYNELELNEVATAFSNLFNA